MSYIRIDTSRVDAREVGGELVILDLKAQRYLGGNRSAALLWPLLVEGASREALADRLVTEWSVDSERARADVEALIGTLEQLDLLEGPDTPAS
jgi:hypothetical protein